MRGLLYKDILLSRRLMIVFTVLTLGVAGGCILFTDKFSNAPDDVYLIKGIILYVPFFLASLVNSDNLREDEKRVWCSFVISSPQSVRGQILCKYVILVIENLFVFALCLVIDLICCNMLNGLESSAWKLLIVFFALNIITNAIEVPFMVRFGSARGMQIKGSLFVIVFSVIAIYFLFGDLTFFREHNFFDWLLELVTTAPDMNKICIWAGIIAVVLYAISYYISTLLYRSGVEAYDN